MKKAVYLTIIILTIAGCSKNPDSPGGPLGIEYIYEQVMDIVRTGDKYVLIDSSFSTFELTDNGQVKLLKSNSPEYFYEIKTGRNFSGNFDFQTYYYFSNAPQCYYVCFFDWSWSSCFYELEKNTFEKKFFNFIQGMPGGLYYYDNKLWYISGIKMGGLDSHSILRCYDPVTGDIILQIPMPTVNAKGLYIDESGFVVFDRNTKSLLTFNIDYENNSIIF